MMWAAQKGYLEIVKQLVEIGKADVLASDKTSDTALTIATWHGNESVVEYLAPLSKLSDCETEEGMDALHLAIAKDNPSMVSILLQAGASINTLDKRDHTALLAASVHTSGSAILTLLFESKQAFDVNISG
uniref:Uncharacterized protein n=1 Tax=Capitella teleta TaxID=283909 RepID=X2B278_CAPTE